MSGVTIVVGRSAAGRRPTPHGKALSCILPFSALDSSPTSSEIDASSRNGSSFVEETSFDLQPSKPDSGPSSRIRCEESSEFICLTDLACSLELASWNKKETVSARIWQRRGTAKGSRPRRRGGDRNSNAYLSQLETGKNPASRRRRTSTSLASSTEYRMQPYWNLPDIQCRAPKRGGHRSQA